MGLSLNGVRKEHIYLAWLKQRQRDFLDSQNHPAGTEVFLDQGSGRPILGIRKDPDVGRLHIELKGISFLKFPDMGRNQRNPSFPAADVLSSDANIDFHYDSFFDYITGRYYVIF
jgi:hypothetical protein